MTQQDKLKMMAQSAMSSAAEALAASHRAWASLTREVTLRNDNAAFVAEQGMAAQIVALSAASRFIEAYAAEARQQLEEAERQLKLAQKLESVLSDDTTSTQSPQRVG
jgi:hypothetical protein